MNRKNYLKTLVFAFGALAVTLVGCKKDKEEDKMLIPKITGTKGVYMLCEGTMGSENSVITYYDIEKKTTVKDYYKQVNGTGLGETAIDLKPYGSKMYCVVSGIQGAKKSFIDVMDIQTGKSIKRISFNGDTEGFLPRFITFYKDKAYVSRYDGVISRIDTASLTVDANLQLRNGNVNAAGLEGLAVANGKLYVTNSVHPLHPSGGNQVSVIDLATFTKSKDITVTINPVRIAASAAGELLVISWGNYSTINPSVQKISSVTDQVTGTYQIDASALAIGRDQAYLVTDWGYGFLKFNLANGTTNNFISDGTAFTGGYGVTVGSFDQNVVFADAMNYAAEGKALVFDKDGKKLYEFATGPLPQHAIFNYKYEYEYKAF